MNFWGYDIFNSQKNLITEEQQKENVDLEMCAVGWYYYFSAWYSVLQLYNI
jgi:hypothetical protein